MIKNKLDFDLEEFYQHEHDLSKDQQTYVLNCIGSAVGKLKQLCQAVDAINELLNSVTMAHLNDFTALAKRIMELERFQDITHLQYQKVIKKQCDHRILSGAILIDGKCMKCGEIA